MIWRKPLKLFNPQLSQALNFAYLAPAFLNKKHHGKIRQALP